MWELARSLPKSAKGLYDYKVGYDLVKVMVENEKIMQEHCKKTLGLDMI